ncbi:serine/threonine-protein kinase [Nocardiopsis sp. N85]|uniref:serine/threonine-protein kinase n=1 Tax=Nocardiopsis sp. N85 TaxID=3029400 RepID=UPI00237F4A06|nr:serine/threonine-protein kinase [Nocardiopsis sp. N85]MDE3721471.1 serine/threonine-protein kinase [Nocardiopsis sp. N85]
MTSNGQQSGRPLRAGDPQELGGHRIVGRLGRGGMGTVYLAEDASGRRVAVKLIHPDLADDAAFRARFAREVESARRVARFSTAGVIDARLDGDPLFIVSEYVQGPNLDEAVRQGGPMTGGTLEGLAMGVAAALTAIHGSGIIHRDLKPANVLLSPVGPKVIDFGIARALDDSGGGVTRSSQLMGTPSYMAPELLLGEKPTAAADIFAWGCLVAFAGIGEAPFDAPTVPAVLYNITTAPPRLEGLEPSLYDLVAAALDKDPARRPTSQRILARLTGQEDPPEAEVRRTITDAWAAPSGAPVPGTPPGQGHPTAGSATPSHGQTPPDGATDQVREPSYPVPPPGGAPAGAPVPPTRYGMDPAQSHAPGGQRSPYPPPGPAHHGPSGGQAPPTFHGRAHYGPTGGQAPPTRQTPGGHSSPPHDRYAFGAHAGPGGPGTPVPPRGGSDANGSPGGRKRRLLGIGAGVGALVLIVGIGAVALSSRGEEVPPSTSLIDIDFSQNPEWETQVFDPEEDRDGYWAGQRGYLLTWDGGNPHPSRGARVPLELPGERDVASGVVVSTRAYVVEGAAAGTFGVRCWYNIDDARDDNLTRYEALVRFDGGRVELHRVDEAAGGGRELASSGDIGDFQTYPAIDPNAGDRSYDASDPYDFDAESVPTNSITLACRHHDGEDGDEEERMDLSVWVNEEHVLSYTDDDPLPDNAEEPGERRQTGIMVRPGPGQEPLGVLFTDFYIGEIPEEETH